MGPRFGCVFGLVGRKRDGKTEFWPAWETKFTEWDSDSSMNNYLGTLYVAGTLE